jgi:hypothetical protein
VHSLYYVIPYLCTTHTLYVEDEDEVTMNFNSWEDEAELTNNFNYRDKQPEEYIVGSLPSSLNQEK